MMWYSELGAYGAQINGERGVGGIAGWQDVEVIRVPEVWCDTERDGDASECASGGEKWD